MDEEENKNPSLGSKAKERNGMQAESSNSFFKVRITYVWLSLGNDLFGPIYDALNLERDKLWQREDHFEKLLSALQTNPQ